MNYRKLSLAKRNLLAYLIILGMFSCSPKLRLTGSEKNQYPISSDRPKDEKIIEYYLPYKKRVDSLLNGIIAVSAVEIVKSRPEGPLNNLMADAMFAAGKSRNIDFDLAYTNYGGLRVPLPKGNIPLFKVYELMPFENLITTVKFSGPDMLSFFDYMAAMGGDPISGASYIIRNKKAADIKINGQAFDPARSYTVLTSDYMANGGDGGEIFLKSTDRKEYDLKLRDALIIYLQHQTNEGRMLNPQRDGRIKVE
ncbi:MAG: 5'-nucleotidase C-terminal domain-containing protein [Daejeonella sp.]|uniref:5'-nucleotidase C-terminal domain-containing protein n=1 Tax=Daejeonella sp. JGW-45 TaxID=3034148 RepID=UPI0023EC2490|nr:5'-nucleotidase C-terminal domain-containing protein [Daejeonella sp. JGW-45]